MGHSVNAIGFRLNRFRKWKVTTSPQLERVRSGYLNFLYFDSFLSRFFSKFPAVYYSHFEYTANNRGSVELRIFLYSNGWAALIRLLRARSKSRLAYPFSVFSSVFVESSFAPLERGVSLPYNLSYRRFLKWELSRFFSRLLSAIFADYSRLDPFTKVSSCTVTLVERPSPSLAPLFSRFLSLKIKKRHPVAKVVNSLIKFLLHKPERWGILGCFVRANGRLTRTQRATSFVSKKGKTPFSSTEVAMSYSSTSVILKYGTCSVHVWISFSS